MNHSNDEKPETQKPHGQPLMMSSAGLKVMRNALDKSSAQAYAWASSRYGNVLEAAELLEVNSGAAIGAHALAFTSPQSAAVFAVSVFLSTISNFFVAKIKDLQNTTQATIADVRSFVHNRSNDKDSSDGPDAPKG